MTSRTNFARRVFLIAGIYGVIAHDVVRFRPLMPVAVLEKVAFGAAVVALYGQGRVAGSVLTAGLVDLLLGCLFAAAFVATARE